MKWIIRIGLVLVVAIAGGWIFRAEIALFGINQMMAAQAEIGPTQEINWSTGTDAEGRSPEDRRALVSEPLGGSGQLGID